MPKRSGIMIYFENWKPIMQLPDGEIAKLLRAALDYGETGHEPTDIKANVYFNALWIQIRETIKRDEARYDETCRKNRYNVYKREEKRYNREPLEYDVWCEEIDRYRSISNDNQPITTDNDTNQTQTESQETNENSNEQTKADKPPRAARFVPPTVEEVAEYCRERGNHVDAQAFVDHYQANGWMRGKNKVQDWRACVRTWEREDKKTSGPPLKTPYDDLQPKSTDGDDLERLAKMLGVET